ncbi:MAG: hypothetical protein IT202_01805 [Fimbriimonadaceae bacterium]|nr:hypothetical protein [Fimbriimonadaceae bacterium]MCC6351226.1 hypothetical protein [Fimbriimonadaceae bacterium]
MARWDNFHVWRARLPHWRADGVTYFVTFRHSRPLTPPEVHVLFACLLQPEGKRWNLDCLCVLPEKTELLVRVPKGSGGKQAELSDVVEKAKSKAGKAILKKSGERFPPFYRESYDHIVRDDDEFHQFWESIIFSPAEQGLVEAAEEYDALYVAGA